MHVGGGGGGVGVGMTQSSGIVLDLVVNSLWKSTQV